VKKQVKNAVKTKSLVEKNGKALSLNFQSFAVKTRKLYHFNDKAFSFSPIKDFFPEN